MNTVLISFVSFTTHNFICETGKHSVALLHYPMYVLPVEYKIPEDRNTVLFIALCSTYTTTWHKVGVQKFSRITK